MYSKEQLTAFKLLMIEGLEEYKRQRGRWHVPVQEFADWMGTSPASTDAWLNGLRAPDLPNMIKISQRLGPKVFTIFGIDRTIIITDVKLGYIIDAWETLDNDAKERILQLFSELGGIERR